MTFHRCAIAALVAALGLAGFAGCKKNAEAPAASPTGEGAPAGKPYRFAFVTNNSSDFWNIAEKGVHKAEKDLGIQAVVMRPLKTEVGEQQRFIEDILVQGFDGMAIAPISPDPMTPLLDRVAEKMPVVCHDGDVRSTASRASTRRWASSPGSRSCRSFSTTPTGPRPRRTSRTRWRVTRTW
jgi:ABC-type sugar transport system substrate-binding protein